MRIKDFTDTIRHLTDPFNIPEARRMIQENPALSREQFAEGQLVQPGPGRQGYQGRPHGSPQMGGRQVDWTPARKANLKTWMDARGTTLKDYKKASPSKQWSIREGQTTGIKHSKDYRKHLEGPESKAFRAWLDTQDPDIKSRNLQDLIKQSQSGVNKDSASKIIDEPKYFKKFGNVKEGTKRRLHEKMVTKHLGKGLYQETSPTGNVSYFGSVKRKGKSYKKRFRDIEEAKEFIVEKKKLPSAPSIIEQQSVKGTLLEQPKYKKALVDAMDEVYAMENKGYGAIRELTQKYKDMFSKKGTTQLGTKITSDISTEGSALVNAIRTEADKLGLYDVNSKKMEKALDFYGNKKIIKKGDIVKIADKFGIEYGTLQGVLHKKALRRKIPLKYGSDAEKRRAVSKARERALAKYSSRAYEDSVLGTRKTQLGHGSDIYTQHTTPEDLIYTPAKINQEALKKTDAIHNAIYKKRANLFKNKPGGWEKEVERLNAKGMKLADQSQGYKNFNIKRADGSTYKYGVDASKTIDPLGVATGKRLKDLTKEDKALIELNRQNVFKAQDKMGKKQIKTIIERIGCPGLAGGGRATFKDGSTCYSKGLEKVKIGNIKTPGERANFIKLAKKAGGLKGIARITGLGLAWEAAFAPVMAAWMMPGGESPARILNELAYGLPIVGETEKEERKRHMGETGFNVSELRNLSGDRKYLQMELNEEINRSGGREGKSYKQYQIEQQIKKLDKKLIPLVGHFYEGPAGQYFGEEKTRLGEEAEVKGLESLEQSRVDWIKKYQDLGLVAKPGWKKHFRTHRMGGGIMGLKK